MNQSIRRIPTLAVLVALMMMALLATSASAMLLPDRPGEKDRTSVGESTIAPGRYIVVFKNSVESPGVLAETQTEQRDGELGFIYRHALKGYSAENLSESDVQALRNNPTVKYVVPDHKVKAQAQSTPTGVKRIFATENNALDIDETDDIRVNADVAVIDTGIDYTHPDLNVVFRTDCVPPEEVGNTTCVDNSGVDLYGHGSHVGGIVGALDNGFGTVGAAPGARLWSVRVLGKYGEGWTSWIIAGIDWVTEHASDIEIANMSLGGEGESLPEKEAIAASIDAGVVYVVAAGNSSSDVAGFSPAGFPEVITVSALADYDGKPGGEFEGSPKECSKSGWDDGLAAFSNRGQGVDIAAPGVCIYSTYNEGLYGTFSGTSMASPYVAGAAAVLASQSNPNSQQDVEAIAKTLIDEGKLSWIQDSFSGDPDEWMAIAPEPLLYMGDAALPGEAETTRALDVGLNGLRFRGAINTRGQKATYKVEYGKTTSYGSSVPVPASEELPAESQYTRVSKTAIGLTIGETYHYRLAVTTPEGTIYGPDRTHIHRHGGAAYAFSVGSQGSGNGQLDSPEGGLAFDSAGNLWVADTFNNRLEKFDPSGKYITQFGKGGNGAGEFNNPADIAIDTAGNIWVADKYNDRIQKFDPSGKYITQLGKEEGSGDGEFNQPTGLAVDAAGNIWVADRNNHRLQKFDPAGKYITQVGKEGSGNGEFKSPTDVAIDSMGNLWVTDAQNDRVQVFDSKGSYLGKLVNSLDHPRGLVFDSEGNLWVSVREYKWISGFTTEGFKNGQGEYVPGKNLTSFGQGGTGEGQFGNGLGHLAVDSKGNIWVGDAGNDRLQKWSFSLSKLPPTYSFSVGYEGSGNGKFKNPEDGVVFDSAGNFWVSDTLNNRVQKFNSKGEYLSQFGSYGTGKGQFDRPQDIAIDPVGDLWVVDSWNNRLQKFNPKGEYLDQFGIEGSGNGQLKGPAGIAIDATGNLWIADSGNNRLQKFNPKGEYLDQFGTKGTGSGQFEAPRDVVIGLEGNLWVPDRLNRRVQVFNPSGEYVAQFGSQGTGDGQFESSPAAAAFDLAGNLWVSDTGNNRLQVWSFISPKVTTEAANPVSAIEATLNGSVDPNGTDTTYQFEYGKTTSYGKKAPASPKGIGSGTDAVKVGEQIKGLEPNTTYHFRLVATSEAGTTIGEGKTFTTTRAVGPATYASSFGSKGLGNGQFSSPRGVAVDPSGNVWVADTGNNRVQKFNSKGEYLCQIGTKGSGNGQFYEPWALATDASGNVWVADTNNNRLQKLNSSCEYVSQFGKNGTFNGGFSTPVGVAIDPTGNIWVIDPFRSQVTKFSPEGEYLLKFGKEGSGNGQFYESAGITSDSDGNVWVTDQNNYRIQKFNSRGEYLTQFGKSGSGGGQFGGPRGIAVDPEGTLWIAERYNHRAQQIYPEGEYVSQFGSKGSEAGQFSEPHGIAADAAGSLWIADTLNHRIQKWTRPTPPAVDTEAASAIKRSTATLNASINPEGTATSYQLEYGTSTSYGNVVPASPKSIGSGSSRVTVNEAISGLKAGTTYYYHVVATSEKGTVYGETRHFTTAATPGAEAKWLIGGKTLAQLGGAKASIAIEGPFKIEIPSLLQTWNCTQTVNSSSLSGTNSIELTLTLNCKAAWEEKCVIQPITLEFSGTPTALKPKYPTFTMKTEGCGWVGAQYVLPESFSAEIGTEAVKVPVYTSASGLFGVHTMTYSSPSTWQLIGEQAGKELGFGDATFAFDPKFELTFGSSGSENGKFKAPKGIVADSSGNLWVIDQGNNRVQKFNAKAEYQSQFGIEGTANGQFKVPTDIAIGSGNLFVTDSENHRVQKFNSKGEYLSQFGSANLTYPEGLAIDSSGNVWVVDSSCGCVKKFNSKGEYQSQFGTKGAGNGQLSSPSDVVIDSSGNLWVTDRGNNRVQKFNSKGEYQSQFGGLSSPEGILIDPEGNLWIVDKGNNRFKKFNSKGELVKQYGAVGSGNSQFTSPAYIALDAKGRFWVTDTGNNRVHKWSH